MNKRNYISLANKAANIQINELKKVKKKYGPWWDGKVDAQLRRSMPLKHLVLLVIIFCFELVLLPVSNSLSSKSNFRIFNFERSN